MNKWVLPSGGGVYAAPAMFTMIPYPGLFQQRSEASRESTKKAHASFAGMGRRVLD
jgi:hypothetical protein